MFCPFATPQLLLYPFLNVPVSLLLCPPFRKYAIMLQYVSLLIGFHSKMYGGEIKANFNTYLAVKSALWNYQGQIYYVHRPLD